MGPLRFVNRRQYAWMMVALLLGVPVLLLAVWTFVPGVERYLKYVNYACFIMVALLTGSRFADAGYRRWIGTALVFVIGVGLPVIGGLSLNFLVPKQQHELAIIAGVAVIMIVLLAFIIWAGTRKSVPSGEFDDGMSDGRIEPRF
jgi:peptidoglycan/LPS O-acetylase OafA/YrhL